MIPVVVPFGLPRATRWASLLTLMAALLVPGAHAATRDDEPRWEQLTTAERQVLQPLQHEWPLIDATRKLKWRELAMQFPKLSAERQELLRSRMKAWARMTPPERAAARLRYQEAKQLPEAERQARWQSYQSLPEEQRKALADKAQSRVSAAQPVKRPASAGLADVQPKSTLATPGSPASPTPPAARAIAPGTVRATVGASTRPIDERPARPKQPQSSLPKIVASPDLVDRSTLLPRRDAQGATTVPIADREQRLP